MTLKSFEGKHFLKTIRRDMTASNTDSLTAGRRYCDLQLLTGELCRRNKAFAKLTSPYDVIQEMAHGMAALRPDVFLFEPDKHSRAARLWFLLEGHISFKTGRIHIRAENDQRLAVTKSKTGAFGIRHEGNNSRRQV